MKTAHEIYCSRKNIFTHLLLLFLNYCCNVEKSFTDIENHAFFRKNIFKDLFSFLSVRKQFDNKVLRHVFKRFHNQSRICGKGVGLGLVPSYSLQSQSYQFNGIARIGSYYVGQFLRKSKKSKMVVFGHFWVNLGCFSHPSNTNLMKLHTKDNNIE